MRATSVSIDAARQHRADRHDEAREQEEEERQHQGCRAQLLSAAAALQRAAQAAGVASAPANAAWSAAAAPRCIAPRVDAAGLYLATQALKRWLSLSRFSSQNLSLMYSADGDVLRRRGEVRQHVLVDQRRRGLGRHAVGDLRRQVLLVLRIVDEDEVLFRLAPCSACPS